MKHKSELHLRLLIKEMLKPDNTLGLDGCRGLAVFDFDSTLANTKEKVGVKFPGDKNFRYVSSQEYAKMDPADIEQFDFSEFDSVAGAKPIQPTINMLRDALTCGAKNAIILTARAPAAEQDIRRFLNSITDDNNDPILKLQRVDTVNSSDAKKKARAIESYLREFNPTIIHFYEDTEKNLLAVKDMVKTSPQFAGTTVVLHKVSPDGSIGFEEVVYEAPEASKKESDFNLSETKEQVRQFLFEALTQSDENRIATIARKEARKIFDDKLERKVLAIIKSELKGKVAEETIVKICKNVLTSLFKSFWIKRNFWRSELKNSPH
tara:strand:- start:216 stop:1181 length:966 start_codon:yes stop_codon:yes gene_type:complete